MNSGVLQTIAFDDTGSVYLPYAFEGFDQFTAGASTILWFIANNGQMCNASTTPTTNVTGRRILGAMVKGETDPQKLAAWAGNRLKCTSPQLVAALTGKVLAMHERLPGLFGQRLQTIDEQIEELKGRSAATLATRFSRSNKSDDMAAK